MNALAAAAVVLVLALAGAFAGAVPGGTAAVTVVIPYVAFLTLVVGVAWRVSQWAATPVPYRIPTTCGQQRSLPWIVTAPIDHPDTGRMAALRVAIEALAFRSLLRNSRAHVRGNRLEFSEERLLWLAALALHWSLLIVVLRHLRFALQPVPFFVPLLDTFDGLLQIGAPALLMTDILMVAALLFLLGRRLVNPLLRYLSLFTDYFALLLLLGIALSGIALRYGARVDIVSVKALVLGLASLHPAVPAAPSPIFLVHLLLVSTLAIYLPFSKLMHFGGVFLSPTRNLANNSRRVRHVNPWNHPVPTHSYAEWEAENADKMNLAGLPLDGGDHVG
ncbi:MAG: sulfate reduction electron transfer complex DsrMKJOP subunit DsrM [Pseudomonadota bacterium]|nr:sulfate reduction electron transfer complex DsrMKJOP subunit DsrM [Pseudomonadota bacterium]